MKKLLAIVLAAVMAFGSFTMVSFAAEEVPAEKEGLNATEIVVALVGLIKGEDADAEFSVGEVINAVLGVAKGEIEVELNVGELVDTVLGLLESEEESFGIQDIIDIANAIVNGEADFNGDGVLDVNDLLDLIEERITTDAGDDQEALMIISIIFKVIKVLFNLVSGLFAA